MTATLPLFAVQGAWEVRSKRDPVAMALFDRHYSRQQPGRGEVGPPGRKLVLVSRDEQSLWCTHWPLAEYTLDHIDAWRCSVFRREGGELASSLIREAMEVTARLWDERPADGWLTFVDRRKVATANPGYCFKQAGWTLDRAFSHRHLLRFRAESPR